MQCYIGFRCAMWWFNTSILHSVLITSAFLHPRHLSHPSPHHVPTSPPLTFSVFSFRLYDVCVGGRLYTQKDFQIPEFGECESSASFCLFPTTPLVPHIVDACSYLLQCWSESLPCQCAHWCDVLTQPAQLIGLCAKGQLRGLKSSIWCGHCFPVASSPEGSLYNYMNVYN